MRVSCGESRCGAVSGGRFDHRLLVTGPHGQLSTVLAIDCKGGTALITQVAPPLEGGLAVAPAGFGTHAGELIAPDESSGAILAISAGGQSTILVASGIAHGGDIGVESAAFIPPGFSPGTANGNYIVGPRHAQQPAPWDGHDPQDDVR